MTRVSSQGFTLFEMIITLAVAGVLAAFAVPAFQTIQVNSSISSAAADVVHTITDMRSRAVAGRVNVYALQGVGSTAADVGLATAGDWSAGWRITRGPLPATSTPVAKIERARDRDGNSGSSAIRTYVYNAAPSNAATGTMAGNQIEAFGFNNFGRMIAKNGTQLANVSIVVCAPNATFERGRVITLTGMGRVVNSVVANPVTCP